MIEKKMLSKLGMGTWGIGGFAKKEPENNDKKQVESLKYMIDKGVNYIESCLWYAEGHSSNLTAEAFKQSKIDREEIFLTQTIYHFYIDSIQDIENEFSKFVRIFNTDYIDSLQFSMLCINKIGYDKIVDFLFDLIDKGKIRYTSLTNANLEFLKKYNATFGDKLFAHECGFNFEIRENENLGITNFAESNSVQNIVYQPLRRNRTLTNRYKLLTELSQKYKRTENQIILNWIVSKGFFPITKSETIEHIEQHLASFDFKISDDDLTRLNDFRVPGYISPKIDWEGTGDGVLVDQLSNVFDNLIK